jgi:putative chitinase
MITQNQLRAIAGPKAKPAITQNIADSQQVLADFGLKPPHRLAHFIAQIAHESDRFATLTEYASGAAYEGRRDLGNTKPGDGRRYRGRSPIQLTGRYNYRAFTQWARTKYPQAPDFEADPDKVLESPWSLLAAVWYWESRNLSAYADANNIEMITRRINGGLNGYADRLDLYTRTGLTLLGYEMKAGVVKEFQQRNGLKADDIAGPATRAAIHNALLTLVPQADDELSEEDLDDVIIEGDEVKMPLSLWQLILKMLGF